MLLLVLATGAAGAVALWAAIRLEMWLDAAEPVVAREPEGDHRVSQAGADRGFR